MPGRRMESERLHPLAGRLADYGFLGAQHFGLRHRGHTDPDEYVGEPTAGEHGHVPRRQWSLFHQPHLGAVHREGVGQHGQLLHGGADYSRFADPAPGQFGNLPYLGLVGPRFFDQDLSIVKNIQIKERLNFEMRLEAFDLFNNPNFGGAQLSTDSTTFGQLTSTVDTARGGGVTSRIIQWAVRLHF